MKYTFSFIISKKHTLQYLQVILKKVRTTNIHTQKGF